MIQQQWNSASLRHLRQSGADRQLHPRGRAAAQPEGPCLARGQPAGSRTGRAPAGAHHALAVAHRDRPRILRAGRGHPGRGRRRPARRAEGPGRAARHAAPELRRRVRHARRQRLGARVPAALSGRARRRGNDRRAWWTSCTRASTWPCAWARWPTPPWPRASSGELRLWPVRRARLPAAPRRARPPRRAWRSTTWSAFRGSRAAPGLELSHAAPSLQRVEPAGPPGRQQQLRGARCCGGRPGHRPAAAAAGAARGRRRPLVPVLPDWRLPSAPVHAVFASARYLTPKVRAFIDLAVEAFAD